MHVLRSRKAIVLLAAALAVAASSVIVTVAVASHGGPHGAPVAKVLVDTFGNVRLRIVENEFVPTAAEPTFDSGWHTHPGPVFIQVKSGTLQFFTAIGCATPATAGPGQTYIETPNTPLRAVSQGAATWTATLLLWNTAGSGTASPPAQTNVASPC